MRPPDRAAPSWHHTANRASLAVCAIAVAAAAAIAATGGIGSLTRTRRSSCWRSPVRSSSGGHARPAAVLPPQAAHLVAVPPALTVWLILSLAVGWAAFST